MATSASTSRVIRVRRSQIKPQVVKRALQIPKRMGILLFGTSLFLVGAAPAWAQVGPALRVQLQQTPNATPVRGVLVTIGGHRATSDYSGVAHFPYLEQPPTDIAIHDLGYHFVDRALTADEQNSGLATVELQPMASAELSMRVVMADVGDAVAGAHVVLERTSGAYVPVVVEAWVGLDGNLKVRDLPIGEYSISSDAAGCKSHKMQVTIGPGASALEIPLLPDLGQVTVEGTAVDAWSGKAVSGAMVRAVHTPREGLAAAVAQTATGADGRFTLGGIPTGLRRFASPNGTTRPANERLVAWIAADGYLGAVYPLEFSGRGAANLRVLMWPAIGVLEEREPNDKLAEAQATPPTTTLRTHVAQPQDRDSFQLTLPVDGELQVHIERIPIALSLRLFEMRKSQEVARTSQHPNVTYDWRIDLRAGEYVLLVEHWGNQAASPAPFELPIVFQPVVDAHERNDSADLAAAETLPARWSGFLFPRGEVDYQRFHAPRAGSGQVTVSALPIAVDLSVLDDEGQSCARQAVHPQNSLTCPFHFDRRTAFYTRTEHWGRNDYSLTPYEATVEYVPGDAREDGRRNERLGDATSIEPTGILSATLNPVGDCDCYRLEVAESGVLHVRLSAIPIGTELRVTDAAGAVLARRAEHPERLNELDVSLRQRGTYHVQVEHWGRTDWSASPYLLQTAFYPNDVRDRRDNGEHARATPITPATDLVGSIGFVGDRDCYRVFLPRRGVLRAEVAPLSIGLDGSIWDPNGGHVVRQAVHPQQPLRMDGHVKTPGWQVIQVEHWGNNAWARDTYRLERTIWLEDPFEVNDSAQSAAPLPLNTAVSGSLLPIGDQDYYRVYLPSAGRYFLHVTRLPIGLDACVLDAQGKVVGRRAVHPQQPLQLDWEAPAPGPCWIRLEHWGRSDWSAEHYTLHVTPADTTAVPPSARLDVRQAGRARRQVTFLPASGGDAVPVKSYEIDFDADGRFDWRAGAAEIATHTYDRGAWFTATLRVTAANGLAAYDYAIVNTRELSDEQQPQVEFIKPAPTAAVDEPFDVEVLAWRPDGGPTGCLQLEVDGLPVQEWVAEPFVATLRPERWAGRTVTLAAMVAGVDAARAELRLVVSPLVNLLPPADALLTSPRVTFQWDTPASASSEVQVTGPDGDVQVFTGEAGTRHVVLAAELARDREYTWVARSGEQTSEPRRFRLVRGIEFVERAYQFAIERDYDQQRSIRVVNHSETPETLKLHVDSEHGTLLAGFVGEGSPDKVIELEPGEHRDVRLVFAAQDARAAQFRFPITLESLRSASGDTHTDVAEVTVDVRMPNVEFNAELVGQNAATLARQVEVHNTGDALTDFTATAEAAGDYQVYVTPTMDHVSLRRGESVRFDVVPVLFEGFTACEAELVLRAAHVDHRIPLSFAVPAGQSVFLATVDVTASVGSNSRYCTNNPSIGTSLTIPGVGRHWPPPLPGVRAPLTESDDPAIKKYLRERIEEWIKRRALNPKQEKLMLEILNLNFYEADGAWFGDPRAAMREMMNFLRESNYSELTRWERFNAESRSTDGLDRALRALRYPDIQQYTSFLGSAGSALGEFANIDAAEIKRLQDLLRDLTGQTEAMSTAGRQLATTADLAKHQDHLKAMLKNVDTVHAYMVRNMPATNTTFQELVRYRATLQDQIRKAGTLQSKIQDATAKLHQYVTGATSSSGDVTRGLLNKKWLDRLQTAGKFMTVLSFGTGVVNRYERLARREGISEGEAWALAFVQTLAYTAATYTPLGGAADIGEGAIAWGLEKSGIGDATGLKDLLGTKDLAELNLENLVDVAGEGALFLTQCLGDDDGAALPIAMRRVRDMIDRIDERLPTASAAEQQHLRELRARLAKILQDKENDP